MMAVKKKAEFNAPADQVEKAEAVAAITPGRLLGTWTNCDKATRGVVKVILSGNLVVQAFGACHPTPCDWGKAEKTDLWAADVSSSQAVAFSALWTFGFKATIMVGVLDRGSLIVETFDAFTDGSGRSNYYSKYYLCKH